MSASPEDYAQLVHNTTNHAPVSAAVVETFETLRNECQVFGAMILNDCPPSRERSLAMTQLEQTLMWAIASVARYQPKADA